MKRIIALAAVSAIIFLVSASVSHSSNNLIYGTWKIITGKHNSIPAPQIMMDRTQKFGKDNTFESVVHSEKGSFCMNLGTFHLINDTTMVTFHKDQFGNVSNIANTYNFHIKNDSLHLYGFYLRPIPQGNTLMKVFIDEWWIRANEK